MIIPATILAYLFIGVVFTALSLWLSVRRSEKPDINTAWVDFYLWPLAVLVILCRIAVAVPSLLAEKLAAWMIRRHNRKE